jgi:hypothetical protein
MDLVAALILDAHWCRAPGDALAVLKNKTQKFNQNKIPKTYTRIDLKTPTSKTHRVGGAVHPSALGHSLLLICTPKMIFV